MNRANKEKLQQEIAEILYGCYSKDLSVCEKHEIFRPQLAAIRLVAAGFRKLS